MAAALTPPFTVAALVLCVAGAAKLRSPASARQALQALGLPPLVAPLAFAELTVGIACVVAPGRATAVALACAYATLCGVAIVLAARRAGCGCFGEGDAPASVAQALLSAMLAGIAILAAVTASPHGLGWLLAQSPGSAMVIVLGTAGAAYGAVLAYTELPQAWNSWSGR
jgi:hypothetical protein